MMRLRSNPYRIVAWLACGVLLAVSAGCGTGGTLPPAIPAATLPAYPGNLVPPLLIDAEQLASALASDDGGTVVLDASDLATYRAGHIPGAVHAWWQDTMDPNGPVYGTVLKPDPNQPDPQALRRNFLEDLGVDGDVQVVVYDNMAGRRAARVAWTLRFLGYPQTAVLDGGLGAWRGIGGTFEQRERKPRTVEQPGVSPQSPQDAWYVVEAQLLARINDPHYLVVDIRTDGERRDTVDDTISLGTIPGSVRLDWSTLVDTDGRILPPDRLAAVARAAGLTPERRIVLLGLYGADTGLAWLALTLSGYPTVAIYDGGWNEWARDPATPKAPI
jgi:thiosulfate/3-mercaptopyruvate sulfurtransferase